MISVRLQAIIAELKRTANAAVYVVIEIDPSEVLVLIVPRGAEGMPVANPLPLAASAKDAPSGDWAKLNRPTIMTISESVPLLIARPSLEAVPA
jgi:hypothetical protein